MTSRRIEILLLVALLLSLGALRFSLHSAGGPYGTDGSYYVQIARSVSEGHGLRTGVDLYHQGLDPLPAPTNIYPLWPLLLGHAGQLFGLESAIHHLPRILYLLALLALYGLVRRAGGTLWSASLTVALLGMNEIFFTSTTYPYTEALALLLCSIALIAAPRNALVAGCASGLALLARSQMLMLVAGIGLALLFAVITRRRTWKSLALFIAGVVVTVGPWLLWVASFAKPFSFRLLYTSYHQVAAVPTYPLGYSSASAGDFLLMRLRGLAVAFDPWDRESFIALFGVAALLVPIGAVHWLWRNRRPPRTIDVGVLAIAISGTLFVAMLVWMPQQFFRTWLFGWRHGLPLIYLIGLATIELLQHGQRVLRWAATALLLLSIATGAASIVHVIRAGPPGGPTVAERALVNWLASADPATVVLTTNAQSLSAYSGVNFRWAACTESAEVTRTMLRYVRTDFIAVYEPETRCEFVRRLRDVTAPPMVFGTAPQRIYLLPVRPEARGVSSSGVRRAPGG